MSARRAGGTVSADHLDLMRRLRDVGSGAIHHAYQGLCPCVGDDLALRDRDCKACDVLREADALLGDRVSP